jgi:iron complex transport system permease protein
MTSKSAIPLLCAALCVALAAAVALVSGPAGASWTDPAIMDLRGFRIVAATIVGAALAASGVVLQSLMRNPLATPDLLGVASGSGLAMSMLAFSMSLAGHGRQFAWAGPWSTVSAIVGALGALLLVYRLATGSRGLRPHTVVLVGVIIGIMGASLTQFIHQIMPPEQARGAASAFLGGIRENELTWTQLFAIGSMVLLCIARAAMLGPAMDAASLGEDEAISVGVALGSLRRELFIIAGVLSACAVVIAGPIGFVGLICPHIFRLLAGPRHRPLVIGASAIGALLLICGDTLVRIITPPTGRLPLSVFTAVIGGPFLIHMLRLQSRRSHS